VTATHVNGLAVVENEPTVTNLKSNDGKTVYQHQTRTLLLEDSSIVYGCVHCDFTAPKVGQVRSHLGTHAARSSGRPRTKVPKGLTVSDLLSAAAAIEKLTADRDAWRARAVKAERELATVRRVLNGAR
jgi:hypothetical protein